MEKEYKKVLEKYADADLYAMSEEEYAELKEAEMADMQSYVNAITDSNVPEVMYRIGRAVPDLKYLLESSADIWEARCSIIRSCRATRSSLNSHITM